jgi:hypothetical protein
MTQRYTDDQALVRMTHGRCPECGYPASEHGGWVRKCSLREDGVLDRIAQYETDLTQTQGDTKSH